MQTTKSLLFSVWMLAIVALLPAPDAFALNQCESRAFDNKGNEIPGNFTATVTQTVVNGRRSYVYSFIKKSTAGINKLFVWVRRGLHSEPGFFARRVDTGDLGTYLRPHESITGQWPPSQLWSFVHHEDAVAWTAIATENSFEINVKERFSPADSLTTLVLGVANTYEHCGPIAGPKNPAAPAITSNPVLADALTVQFGNGCIYDFFFDPFTNYLTNMAKNQFSPEVGTDGLECGVEFLPSVAQELFGGPGFVPPTRKGDLPIQFPPGGFCRGVLPDGTGFKYPC